MRHDYAVAIARTAIRAMTYEGADGRVYWESDVSGADLVETLSLVIHEDDQGRHIFDSDEDPDRN